MTAPVASLLMSIPDAGSAGFAQSATETAPEAMFGALLAAFAPSSDANPPKNTPNIASGAVPLGGEQAGFADTVLTSAAPPMQENPVRWMAQLESQAVPKEGDALPLIQPNLSLPREQQQPHAAGSVSPPEAPDVIAMPDTKLPGPKLPIYSAAPVPDKGQDAKSEQPPETALDLPDAKLPQPKPPILLAAFVPVEEHGAESEQAPPPALAFPDAKLPQPQTPVLSAAFVPDEEQGAKSEQARATALDLPDVKLPQPKTPILSAAPMPDKGQNAQSEQTPPISIAPPDSNSAEPKALILSAAPMPDKGQNAQSEQAPPNSIALPDSKSPAPKPAMLSASSVPDKGQSAQSEQAPPRAIVSDEISLTLPHKTVATPISAEETSPPVPIAAGKEDGGDIPTGVARLTAEAAPAEEEHAEPQPDAPAASAPKPKTGNIAARTTAHGKQADAPERDFLSDIPSRVAAQFLAARPESAVPPAATQTPDPQTKPAPEHEAAHPPPAGGQANAAPLINVDIPAQEQGVLRPTEEAPKDTAPYSAEANSVSEADAAGRAEDLPRARGRHATKETVAERQTHQTAEIAQLLTPNIPANLPGASAPEIQDGKISSIQAQPEPAPFAAIPDSEQADAPIGSMAPPIKGKAPRPLSSKADAGPVKAPLDNLPATGSKLANPSDSRSPTRNDASAAASDDGSAAKSTADRPDPPVRSAGAPPENLAKNEPIPPAANGPQMSPQPPAGPHHALPDSPAVPNLPATPAAPNDPGAAVKLAFSGPSSALSETPSFDALALKIATRSADGDRNFSIRLDPPELGRIEVHLNVNSDGHAEAELRADRPQTLELLQKDASQLERALKDAGLNLAGSLAFSLKGEGKSGAWRDGQNSQRGRVLQIGAADAASANAALAGSAALAAQAYGLSTARLDIRV